MCQVSSVVLRKKAVNSVLCCHLLHTASCSAFPLGPGPLASFWSDSGKQWQQDCKMVLNEKHGLLPLLLHNHPVRACWVMLGGNDSSWPLLPQGLAQMWLIHGKIPDYGACLFCVAADMKMVCLLVAPVVSQTLEFALRPWIYLFKSPTKLNCIYSQGSVLYVGLQPCSSNLDMKWVPLISVSASFKWACTGFQTFSHSVNPLFFRCVLYRNRKLSKSLYII